MIVQLASAEAANIRYVSMIYERKEMNTSVKLIPRKTAAISGTIQWICG